MDITLSNVSITYKNKKKENNPVIKNISEIFESGKISVILGSSGCGKTTLLKAIAQLLPYDGDIYFGKKNIAEVKLNELNLSYVPQEIHLYPFYTAFDNIAFPLKTRKLPRETILESVREIADKFEISEILNVRPKYLSEGQRQRVMLARELVSNPEVLLFDEPLSSLDLPLKQEICTLLKQYQSRRECEIIYVTHSYLEAKMLADYLYIMENGEIVRKGEANYLLQNQDVYLKQMKDSETIKEK